MIHPPTSSKPLQLPPPTAAAAAASPRTIVNQKTKFYSQAARQVGPSIPTVVVDHNKRSSETIKQHAILFPTKLRCILDDAVTEGNEHIVSWLPDGKAFKIHNPEAFTKVILRRYFRQTMFKSFTRQLYHYGFSKLNDDLDHNTFSHPQFRRNDFESCLSIDRKKHKTTIALHLNILNGGQKISSGGASSSLYTSITTMPVHETLILDERAGSSLQSSLALRNDHRGIHSQSSYHQPALVSSPRKDVVLGSLEDRHVFQEPQKEYFDSRGVTDHGCFFRDNNHDERFSRMMFDTSTMTTPRSSDDWLGRLLGHQLETGGTDDKRQQNTISHDGIDNLMIFEPRTLEEMALFPRSISSIMRTNRR